VRKFAAGLLVSLLPTLLLCGALTLQNNLGILLSPIHVAVATLSVGLLLWIGVRDLPLGSPQLRWGAFASGLTAAPLIAITLEFLVGIFLGLLGIVYISVSPNLVQSLQHLQQVAPTLQQDPSRLLPFLHNFLADPIILTLIVGNFALFVPLIEELVKPIAVWAVIWGRKLTPAQGFGLGMLSGAGFALLENLFSGASAAAWPATSAIRIGATAFHLVTSGLMGWALVRAKEHGRYFAVFAVYAFNILLHSLWNGVVVLNTLASLGEATSGGSFLPFEFPQSALLILLLIALLSVSILAIMNRRLQLSPLAASKPAPRAKSSKRS
jgi:RsiW-degrading membrane proteinase PrsW (M82 family)